jgi:hypothetical protein
LCCDVDRRKLVRSKVVIMVTVAAVSIAAAAVYVGVQAVAAREGTSGAKGPTFAGPAAVAAVQSHKPYIVFRHVSPADPSRYGMIALAPVDDVNGASVVMHQVCSRVYYVAAGGFCMDVAGALGIARRGWVLDSQLEPVREVKLAGFPTRTRVSRDGRYAAATVFNAGGGHSYAEIGAFTTTTKLYDMRTGTTIANLEEFPVLLDNKPIKRRDFNYWGVTFTSDHERFYATLSTAGNLYLVEGNIGTRTIRTLTTGVECPSLSPDETRIAFKRRVGKGSWRLSTLDLRTRHETRLAETASVDDQVEWLDDRRILYGRAGSIWSIPADGTGRPERLIEGADSPAVVR